MIVEIPDDNSIVKWKKNDKEDWKSAEISDLIKTYEERPKGEWIEKEATPVSVYYCCSNCDTRSLPITPFCPWCGADMQGR